MKKILFILALLIGLSSFAQDDFFWSYSHPITKDVITFNTGTTGAYIKAITSSGNSLLYKSSNPDMYIPADNTLQQLYSYNYGSLESKHNDLVSFEILLGYNLNTLDLSKVRRLEYLSIYDCNFTTTLGAEYPVGLEYLNALKKIYLAEISGSISYDFYTQPLLTECVITTNYTLSSVYFNNPMLAFIQVSDCDNLTSVSLGVPNQITNTVYFNGDKLPQSEVDEVLKWCLDGGRTSIDGVCYVDLRGSLMACPSSTGFGYVDILSGRGWNVQVNSCAASLPTVSTLNISNISKYTASSGGNVSSQGSSSVTSRGVCWSTSSNPTISNSHTADGTGLGSFTSSIASLLSNTTYYVRAYATNSSGTSYGNTISFTTLMEQTNPTLITNSATFITTASATSGGVITSDGGAEIIEKGVCFDTSPSPNYSSSKTNDGSGTASFTSLITGLSPNTTYYVRAYARNRELVGGFYVYATGYGHEEVFTTASDVSCNLPNVNTNTVNTITPSSVIGGGNVTNDGNCEVTTKGLCWSILMNPTTSDSHTTDGSGIGAFSSSITGLTCGTTYYVRAYATNSSGTAYGNSVSFTTQPIALASGNQLIFPNYPINPVQVTSGFTNQGCDMIERGVVWSTSHNPTILDNKHVFSSSIEGYISESFYVTPGTYYFSGYAINNIGVSYYAWDYALVIPSPTIDPCTLSVGDSYGGGIVAYVFQSGDPGYVSGQCHGIIAATSDQSTGAYFGCYGSNLSGASSILLKGGQQNTIDIIAGCSDSGTSARLCYDYSSGSYSDWWLPSLDELLKLYQNRTLIGGFDLTKAYSTSSEVDQYSVYSVDFTNGSSSVGSNTKLYPFNVRAIRYF